MRLATVRIDGATRAARVEGQSAHLLGFADVGALLDSGSDWRAAAATDSGEPRPVGTLDFAAVIPAPRKVFCVGLNYKAHILETGAEFPAYPTLFAKFAETLTGPFDTIRLPDDRTDWEAELVVVIGSSVHRASTAQAEAAIAGFTVGNDISVRAYQARTSQWLQGKCFEATAPIGPWLVTTDETSTWPRVDITLSVDGVTKQQSTTADLLFGPAELVEYISHVITLRPGDLIFTGTPSGVGMARDPQEFLRGGQVVETTIDTIGTLRNRCDG